MGIANIKNKTNKQKKKNIVVEYQKIICYDTIDREVVETLSVALLLLFSSLIDFHSKLQQRPSITRKLGICTSEKI